MDVQRQSGAAPVVSAVIPVRDGAPWIGELLESVLSQGVQELEVLVVDNGSIDGTGEIVEGIAAGDGRVRLVNSTATSAAAARNEGVAVASGRYLVFADADDIVPDGAYRAMLAALERSGSDMAIGDHLKFSATSTWSPTERWHPFDRLLEGVAPAEVAPLISGRPCWNRMVRRSFWDRADLRFPDLPNIDDIEPMTRAFVNAERIDVVPACVYLYRERAVGTSLSTTADIATVVRYFIEERRCAELVAADEALAAAHSVVVFDADGWVHLDRYLRAIDESAAPAIREAVHALVDAVPGVGFDLAAAHRRMTWSLVASELWDEAARFSVGRRRDSAEERIRAWTAAVRAIASADADAAGPLTRDGLLVALANDAESCSSAVLVEVLPDLQRACAGIDAGGTEILDAVLAAVRAGDAHGVAAVSRLRRAAPVVVDAAIPGVHGLALSGPTPVLGAADAAELVLQLAGGDHHPVAVPMSFDGEDPCRWSAVVEDSRVTPGRWEVRVRVSLGALEVRLPVVTARMALPPVRPGFLLQPLADRTAGWRFLIDRLAPQPSGVGRILSGVRRRLGAR